MAASAAADAKTKALEEATEKEAISKYGAKDSGASLGDILGKALSDKKTESEE